MSQRQDAETATLKTEQRAGKRFKLQTEPKKLRLQESRRPLSAGVGDIYDMQTIQKDIHTVA